MTCGTSYAALAEIFLSALSLTPTLHVVICDADIFLAEGAYLDLGLHVFAMPPLEFVAILACGIIESTYHCFERFAARYSCLRTDGLDIF